ncbi:MAG: hypothetical protein KGY56_04870 [Desulfobacterales bacterium]|nr:hypothetical protein [Desulfobacterales bacterium]
MFNIPAQTSIQELLTEYGPKMVRESVENQGRTEELKGTEFTLVIDVDGEKYSFVVRDGTDVQVGTDKDLDNAMVRYMISRDELERMIDSQQLDMLLGIITDLNQQKYQTLQGKTSHRLSAGESEFPAILLGHGRPDTSRAALLFFRLRDSSHRCPLRHPRIPARTG